MTILALDRILSQIESWNVSFSAAEQEREIRYFIETEILSSYKVDFFMDLQNEQNGQEIDGQAIGASKFHFKNLHQNWKPFLVLEAFLAELYEETDKIVSFANFFLKFCFSKMVGTFLQFISLFALLDSLATLSWSSQ